MSDIKTVLESATQQGFAIEQQEILEDGTVRIVIGRWAQSELRNKVKTGTQAPMHEAIAAMPEKI